MNRIQDASVMGRNLRLQALWNAAIPQRAFDIEIGETHTTFRLPTKGRRRVSNRRLGLA